MRHFHDVSQQPLLLQQACQLRLELPEAAVAAAEVMERQHRFTGHQGGSLCGWHQHFKGD
jgi:hypothetical protein